MPQSNAEELIEKLVPKKTIPERLAELEQQHVAMQQDIAATQQALAVKQQQLLMTEGAIHVLREFAATEK